jgi:DNA-binding PadR family transcriptional regulator
MERTHDFYGRRRGGPRGRGRGRGHGDFYAGGTGRIHRGDVRDLLLAALLDGPGHGYELMSRLEERTGGRWRPSPGSVYPTLQLLEDRGLVRGRDENGRRIYELTDEGREEADAEKLSGLGLHGGPNGGKHLERREAIAQLRLAAKQIAIAGKVEQVEQATAIVQEARQQIYRLLAEV